MTLEEFNQEVMRLAKLCDAAQPFSETRAAYLDQLGDIWEKEGTAFYPAVIMKSIADAWHDGAKVCRRQA